MYAACAATAAVIASSTAGSHAVQGGSMDTALGVGVTVGAGVGVGDAVGARVGVDVEVRVGIGVSVGIEVAVGASVGVGTRVSVAACVDAGGVHVGKDVGVGVSVAVASAIAVAVGEGRIGFTSSATAVGTTPLPSLATYTPTARASRRMANTAATQPHRERTSRGSVNILCLVPCSSDSRSLAFIPAPFSPMMHEQDTGQSRQDQ
jgi:hypothetical protein